MMKQNEIAKAYSRAEQAKRKCLWPGCNNNAINSHLLQKKGILSLIADSQHLYRLQKNFFTLKMDFVKVGVNDALSFKGFCNKHDTEVFHDIEKEIVDFSKYHDKLLLNYRAIQHSVRKTQVNIDFCEKLRAQAIAQGDINIIGGITGSLEASVENKRNYEEHGDLVLSSINSGVKDFYFTTITAPKLDVAASSVHQIETRSEVIQKYMVGFENFKMSLVFIHIIPRVTDTLIIISCKNDVVHKATPIILEANADPVKFVSDTLIKCIETWVCSPAIYFKSFRQQSRRIVLESEKYPIHADFDEYISLNIFSKWL
jgi:hypothetical protein